MAGNINMVTEIGSNSDGGDREDDGSDGGDRKEERESNICRRIKRE